VSTQQTGFPDFFTARHLMTLIPVFIIWVVRAGYRRTRIQIQKDDFSDLTFGDDDKIGLDAPGQSSTGIGTPK
jgi:hypothetical protein